MLKVAAVPTPFTDADAHDPVPASVRTTQKNPMPVKVLSMDALARPEGHAAAQAQGRETPPPGQKEPAGQG